jgi:hypothetical protein
MGIPIEVPGLDTLIPQLDEGEVVIAESGADPAKSYFIRRICLTAMHQGWPVSILTSRDRAELTSLLEKESPPRLEPPRTPQLVELEELNDLDEYAFRGGLIAIDSFSFLTLVLEPTPLAQMLRRLRTLCREKRTIALLGTDRGLVEPRSEAVTTHLADGVIQFHAREGPEGLIRFLRIPKWRDGRFVDRNVYYDFDGKRMAIDLRRRVI